MKTLGELLSAQRKAKKISLTKVSHDLLIKKENLEFLEKCDWEKLPEPAFVKGFIKSYAKYLDLDPNYILALHRREYDEAKYPHKNFMPKKQKLFILTPRRVINFIFLLVAFIFVGYLTIQYLSILSSPKVEIFNPQDDITTSIPLVQILGKTEKETTVSIDGEFVPIDQEGNFSYEAKLEEGKNIIEIIASKRLSPKNKITRTIRLVH